MLHIQNYVVSHKDTALMVSTKTSLTKSIHVLLQLSIHTIISCYVHTHNTHLDFLASFFVGLSKTNAPKSLNLGDLTPSLLSPSLASSFPLLVLDPASYLVGRASSLLDSLHSSSVMFFLLRVFGLAVAAFFSVANRSSLAPLLSGRGEGGATGAVLTGELVGVVDFEEEVGGVDGTLKGEIEVVLPLRGELVGVANFEVRSEDETGGSDGTLNGEVNLGALSFCTLLDGE